MRESKAKRIRSSIPGALDKPREYSVIQRRARFLDTAFYKDDGIRIQIVNAPDSPRAKYLAAKRVSRKGKACTH